VGAFLGRFRALAEHGNKRDSAVALHLDSTEVVALYAFLALGSHYAATMSGEKSPLSPDEVRTHTAAISTGISSTLIKKVSASIVEILNRERGDPEMDVVKDLRPRFDGEHYREVAGKLRLVAYQCNFSNARQEILKLAISYEQRAHHFDTRAAAAMPDPPGSC